MNIILFRDDRIAQGPPTQAAFENQLEIAAARAGTIRLEKVQAYGEAYYEETDPTIAMQGLYHDLKRKWIRIEQAMRAGLIALADGETLSEALTDLTGYGLMGMQLLEQFKSVEAPVVEKLDQIAIYSDDPTKVRKFLALIFGKELHWEEDMVVASGVVYGGPAENVGELAFNHQICNTEFEVIDYVSGANWIHHNKLKQGLCHIGMHVNNMELWKIHMEHLGFEIAQEVVTDSHTNPNVDGKKNYHYVIYDTVDAVGFYLKLIERIPAAA